MYRRLLDGILRGSTRSALVLGPRQVGKSTLLKSLSPDLAINLASPREYRTYVASPETLEDELRAAGPDVRSVLLDEVQRVPALLDVVQVIADEAPRRFRFLLSGSSARKLKRGRGNLLPGRAHVHHLAPLLRNELGEAFDLERALARGTLPAVFDEPRPDLAGADLHAYVDTYLREEIQAEALVRDIGGYARLLDLVAVSSGRVLNLSSLCQNAGIAFETARRYVEVLEDTLLVHRVPAWSGSGRAALLQHPKLFLFDCGVRNALLRRPVDRVLTDDRGVLLEHLVAHELCARVGTLCPDLKVSHYRTRHGAEVDFIAEFGSETWAIEVKASATVTGSDLLGLRSFAKRAGDIDRSIVLFTGPRARRIGEVEVLPVARFLAELPPSHGS